MIDAVVIKTKEERHRYGNELIVYPEFQVRRSKDIMIRGKSFYAVWDEKKEVWSTDEYDVARMIDEELMDEASQNEKYYAKVTPKILYNFSSNKWSEWVKYCKSLPDSYRELDGTIQFSNDKPKKSAYSTHRLSYPLEEQDCPGYNELMSVLYEEEERKKLEWAIGAVISGESKKIQKFLVLYGGPGTGKSTVINIIQSMFEGYWGLIDAKAITSGDSFGLESLKDNPLIGIQHDADLSRIEDNTKLNSVVSHEKMIINEKFKSRYEMRFRTFLIMGTNKPIKITDSKSGVIRRLIDVHPTGEKMSISKYNKLMKQITYEYSGIAWHCLQVFKELGPDYYDGYIPEDMLMKTNDLYNFVEDNYDMFIESDQITLKVMWRRYKEYCEDANIQYPLTMRTFRDEMRNYFEDYQDRLDGKYSVYIGFLKDVFKYKPMNDSDSSRDDVSSLYEDQNNWLVFNQDKSLLDSVLAGCPAQYAKGRDGVPSVKWEKCKSVLMDLDTSELHYVRPPENMIVIDFDLKNEKGEKDFERNLEAAKKFPPTYAELSKSGSGIHLHYYYDGDISRLSHIVDSDVEIKVFSGASSLRRQVTKCNGLNMVRISSGLPLKEVKKVLNEQVVKSEKALRELIKRNLRKEIHPATKPSVDFIYKILQDAYDSGLKYDVTDLRPAVQTFAMGSTHQVENCLRMVSRMQFRSEEPSEDMGWRGDSGSDEVPIVFYDVEVFPNLFVIVWKKRGEGCQFVKMINPSPEDVEELVRHSRLVGFNNRKYDNHILYGRMMGYNEKQLYDLSQRIIGGDKDAFFGEAYNLSYTDIYDFLSPANKMSLKKWEIKLGIHHQELGLPWDQPVDKSLWGKVAEYCTNDVFATESVWNSKEGRADFKAREVLADWADMTVNSTTNTLTAKIIFGNDPHPQQEFVYTDLSTIFPGYRFDPYGIPKEEYDEGAKIVGGKSIYRGEDPSEGGKVSAVPGMYSNVGVLDITSQHPHSAIRLNIFGDRYTKKFKAIVDSRKYIKHKEYDKAKEVLPEKVHKYLDDPSEAKNLAGGLKGAINPVYGLTSAKFPNKFKDPRNVDNIVAKYGALFMINLRHEVEDRGWKWVHIKTDSIKIADITPEIVEFVMDYGRQYGFEFEYETKYSKMCLVNESTYIAQVCEEDGEKVDPYWTATGDQFKVPYVFKTLFSKEPIVFEDLFETMSASTALYLDFNERLDPEGFNLVGEEFHDYRFIGKVGAFCPMKEGVGGGILLREISENNRKNNRFAAATGTKKRGGKGVYRWMESEMVKTLGLEDSIDRSYYNALVDEAVDTISQYGDFERFVSDDVYEDMSWMNIPNGSEDEVPFEEVMNPPKVA